MTTVTRQITSDQSTQHEGLSYFDVIDAAETSPPKKRPNVSPAPLALVPEAAGEPFLAAEDAEEVLNDINPFGAPLTPEYLDALETSTDIWNRTPQLQRVAWEAFQEEVNAFGALGACMAHQVSHIPPNVVLVNKKGRGDGSLAKGTSLNLLVALSGPTGAGKSGVYKLATELIPPVGHALPGGTGEGLVKIFAVTDTVTEKLGADGKPVLDKDGNTIKLDRALPVIRYLRNEALIHDPEVEKLLTEFGRKGSNASAFIRSMAHGELVGTTTGEVSRRTCLLPNTYRLCGMWGIQYDVAAPFLEGIALGTPQRWTWAPCDEERGVSRDDLTDEDIAELGDLNEYTFIPLDRTPPPDGVTFPFPTWNVGGNVFGTSGGMFPEFVDDNTEMPDPIWVLWSPQMEEDIPRLRRLHTLKKNRLNTIKRTSGWTTAHKREALLLAIESHFILSRIKVAAALGFLHGRTSPSDLDWELSGVFMDVSRRTLASAWTESRDAEIEAMKSLGVRRSREKAYQEKANDAHEEQLVSEGCDVLFKILAKQPWNRRDIQRTKLPKQYRRHTGDIIAAMEDRKTIARDVSGYYYAMHKGAVLPASMADQFKPAV